MSSLGHLSQYLHSGGGKASSDFCSAADHSPVVLQFPGDLTESGVGMQFFATPDFKAVFGAKLCWPQVVP